MHLPLFPPPVWANLWNVKPEEGSKFHTIWNTSDLLKLSSYFQRTGQWMCSGGNLRCSFFIFVFFNFLFVIFEDPAHQRRCRRQTGLRLHICSLIGVLRHPPAFLWKLETAAEASSLLAVQGQGPTPGTNVGEILWTSSSHAETAVINSRGYFQTTLVRFTQRRVWSGPGWASGAGSGYRSVPQIYSGIGLRTTARSIRALGSRQIWWAHSNLSGSAAWLGHFQERRVG